jgi:hypothetical protein
MLVNHACIISIHETKKAVQLLTSTPSKPAATAFFAAATYDSMMVGISDSSRGRGTWYLKGPPCTK